MLLNVFWGGRSVCSGTCVSDRKYWPHLAHTCFSMMGDVTTAAYS